MCDVQKYKLIYDDISKLQPDDTTQLILEADTPEQREFYELVCNFRLQRSQKAAIERNAF